MIAKLIAKGNSFLEKAVTEPACRDCKGQAYKIVSYFANVAEYPRKSRASPLR